MAEAGKYCFLGEFEHTLDGQRRLAIPSEWRVKEGDGRFVLLPARDNILQLLPFETFNEQIVSKARKMSLADSGAMKALAELGSRAQICECDKQGRIQISTRLVEHAKLKGSAILAGSVSCVQIFASEARAKNLDESDSGFYDVLQNIHETPDTLADAFRGVLGEKQK